MIRAAEKADIPAVRALLLEYAEWVGEAICFHSFESEVAALPGAYALFVAVETDLLVGCVGLRELAPGIAEMKRLYVRPEFQGRKLGRALVERAITAARCAGFRSLRLDTLPRMASAIALYTSLGFREIPPYGENPESAICLELQLPSDGNIPAIQT